MQHQVGLSNGFWIYTVKAKIHMYNVTNKTGRLLNTESVMVQLDKVEICELRPEVLTEDDGGLV